VDRVAPDYKAQLEINQSWLRHQAAAVGHPRFSDSAVHFLRAYLTDATALEFKAILAQGSLNEILRGLLRIVFTGQL
jgi:hypothetical protein